MTDDLFRLSTTEVSAPETLPKVIQDNLFKNQAKRFNPVELREHVGLFIGAGSVGSKAIVDCNKLGIGMFVVFDPDILEPHNSIAGMFDYNHLLTTKFEGYTINMIGNNPRSPFKTDRIFFDYILPNDSEVYYQPFKLRYGSDTKKAVKEFAEHLSKFKIKNIYTKTGKLKKGTEYNDKENVVDVNYKSISAYPQPSFVVCTIDNLMGRLEAVAHLRINHANMKTLPYIDAGVKNGVSGQVYTFDLMDDIKLLSYINNYTVEMFTNLDEVLKYIINSPSKLTTIELNTDVCGDKMSVLSSGLANSIIINNIKAIFLSGSRPKYDLVKDTTTFNMSNQNNAPFVNSQDFLIDMLLDKFTLDSIEEFDKLYNEQ